MADLRAPTVGDLPTEGDSAYTEPESDINEDQVKDEARKNQYNLALKMMTTTTCSLTR